MLQHQRRGGRCGATLVVTAPQTPAIRRRRWQERSAWRWPARAAIESLAENFSDGVVAPVFWMLIAGLPGAAVYKAINTADSMIGHRTPRYQAFGWSAARLDDLVNLPASRLSALLIIAADQPKAW